MSHGTNTGNLFSALLPIADNCHADVNLPVSAHSQNADISRTDGATREKTAVFTMNSTSHLV